MDQSHPRPPDENSGRFGERREAPDRHGNQVPSDLSDASTAEQSGAGDPDDADHPEPMLDAHISDYVSRMLAAEGAREGAPQPADVLEAPETSILTFMRSEHGGRATAAEAAPPETMPAGVTKRIAAALAAEARLRVDPGPLRSAGDGAPTDPSTGADPSGSDSPRGSDNVGGSAGSVTPFSRPGRTGPRRSPWMAVAAVAAAAAVIATGGSLLHLNKRTAAAASLSDTSSGARPQSPQSSAEAPPAPTAPPAGQAAPGTPVVHLQLSTTAYAAGNLAQLAREMVDRPGPEIGSGAAESPSIGPIATPVGLASCLRALPPVDASPVLPVSAVSVDLASYDNAPAAIVVVTRGSTSSAWVVERSCSQSDPHVLKPATPVP